MRELTKSEFDALRSKYDGAWTDPSIPQEQLKLTATELADWRVGRIVLGSEHPFSAISALAQCAYGAPDRRDYVNVSSGAVPSRPHGLDVLEVGCATGYNGEVIAPVCKSYVGCDYSEAFVAEAKRLRPALKFTVADARKIPFGDASFHLVIEGGLLIHVAEWQDVLDEAIRCSKQYVIMHRTPWSTDDEPHFYETEAYGVPCLRIHYAAKDVGEFMESRGMRFLNHYMLRNQRDYKMTSSLWERR